jgi:hypothetical protein
MNLRLAVVLGLCFGFSALSLARDANIERGGLGFLFPDQNSFTNPGEFATSHAMSVEGVYQSDTKHADPELAVPSFVFGNGMFGLGVEGVRQAPDVTKSAGAVDLLEAGAGVSLIKERLTLGGTYGRVISANNQGAGVASGTLTLQSPNRHGPSVGVGYNTTVGFANNVHGMTGAVGYAWRSNQNVEANVYFNDTTNWKNYNLAAFFTTAASNFYAAGGYEWLNMTSQHEVLGRLGVVMGMKFDVSVLLGYIFTSGNPITYGFSARISF